MEKFFLANGKKLIGWDEVVADGLTSDAAITWWRSWSKEAVPMATSQGQRVIACPNEYFYFDYAQDKNSVKKILDIRSVCRRPLVTRTERMFLGRAG